jgi:Bacterial Ig-like domain (group 3)/FG-GAP-like repeat
MTHKFSRNYSLSVVVLFSTILMALAIPVAASQAAAVRFAKPVVYPSGGSWIYSVAVGDLNGDGQLDVVVANLCGTYSCDDYFPDIGKISVLLGNGDGTFQPAVIYDSGGFNSYSVAIGDVNGDGYPDLVVSNNCQINDCSSGNVGVLPGNGDGTFQPAISYGTGGFWAYSVAISDVNGDGKPDIVAGTCVVPNGLCAQGMVTVLLGNGDGTFQTAVTYSSGGTSSASVAVGDVNGDGKPDIVVVNGTGTVGVLLGIGDGSFQAPVSYGSGGFGTQSVVIADVNGDGKPDLLVANCGSSGGCGNGTVGVLLGDGDGTFQAPASYPAGPSAQSLAIADVNGDGHPDLAVAGGRGHFGYVNVLVGNGDGTFQSPVSYSSGTDNGGADSIALADLNGDGKPDIVTGNWGDSWVGVLLNEFTATTTTKVTSSLNPSFVNQLVTFTATVTSNSRVPDGQVITFLDGTTAIGTGTTKNGVATFTTSSLSAKTHTIKASYPGDLFHKASSGRATQVVHRYATSTTVASSLNPSDFGQAVTFTATVTSAGPAPTGKVGFKDGTKGIGTVTLSGGVAKLTTSKLAVGTHSITAEYLGDADNAKSTSPVLGQVVD